MPTETPPPYGLHCMEILGGNLPEDRALRTPGLDLRVISRPLDGAGGDVHYVSVCGGGIVTRILLADVSGHGAPVAALAGDLRKLIRKYINTKSQSRLVWQLNNRFEASSKAGLFATSMIATYLANTRKLTLSNAGHPRPLLFRSRTGSWDLLDTTPSTKSTPADLPLGVQHGTHYTQLAVELDPGDQVILYTDFLIESLTASGTPLGEQGVLNLARQLPPNTPSVAQLLLDEILTHAPPNSPKDDVTILEFRQNGQGPRPPKLLEKPRVYGKFFRLIPV